MDETTMLDALQQMLQKRDEKVNRLARGLAWALKYVVEPDLGGVPADYFEWEADHEEVKGLLSEYFETGEER